MIAPCFDQQLIKLLVIHWHKLSDEATQASHIVAYGNGGGNHA